MTGTTVPAALTALETLIATALPTWAVVDGPVYDVPVTSNFVCVGWDGQQGDASVEAVVAPTDAAMASNMESYNVQCALTAHLGTDLLPQLRAVGYGAVETIEQALQANRDLNETVGTAQLVTHQLIQGRTDLGVTVTIPFAIQIQAWK